MTLSIAVFTRNHADWLPRILPQFVQVADELVVIVNESTTDNSVEVARQYTPNVYTVPHEVVPEHQGPRIVSRCNGDWILGMLDDETLSAQWELKEFRRTLLNDRHATHYWIPRRWLVGDGARYISNSRWYPDFQMRLFRNIPSILHYGQNLHSSLTVAGEARYLARAWIYHWDLVWRDRAAREEKLAEYQLASKNTLSEYYLVEEQQFETKPARLDPFGQSTLQPVDRCDLPPDPYRVAVEAIALPEEMKVGGAIRSSCSHCEQVKSHVTAVESAAPQGKNLRQLPLAYT